MYVLSKSNFALVFFAHVKIQSALVQTKGFLMDCFNVLLSKTCQKQRSMYVPQVQC